MRHVEEVTAAAFVTLFTVVCWWYLLSFWVEWPLVLGLFLISVGVQYALNHVKSIWRLRRDKRA